jgi:hypothetical protein
MLNYTSKEMVFPSFCVAIMPYQTTNSNKTFAVHVTDSASRLNNNNNNNNNNSYLESSRTLKN